MNHAQETIAIIGLGYVGLPLAVEFGRTTPVIGFDINADRVAELKAGRDHTRETDPEDLAAARHLVCTTDPAALADATVFIVTVPTPTDKYNRPDLTPVLAASRTVGRAMRPGALVIYESTVYPGCTEEDCVPILERESGLRFNADFFCGYSPERINPGDREHRLVTIRKIVAGSTPAATERTAALYGRIIRAGVFRASSIKVAEAAKVIENTQRDLNIAFMNELSLIFERMGLDTLEVLEAAGTKWNFLPFRPGLVGGHCIGVDPYYLTHKAQSLGYHPEVILAGRRINDAMGRHVAGRVVKLLIRKGIPVNGCRCLVLGITFKENCPDIRNSRVIDIVRELVDFGVRVDVHDPLAAPAEVRAEYGVDLVGNPGADYDAVVVAVAHEPFKAADPRRFLRDARRAVIFDVKGILPKDAADARI